MTLYLKYRPQKIKELDLESVRKTLGEVLASKNIPHAWLFSGPKGTGKTSSARILAKVVNCLSRKGAEPCNKCNSCQLFGSGRSLDLIEIDAASNRGIDDIRDLREKIKLSPAQAKYKIYIIDEAHMLTAEAFNALLKTLEEPPAHAKFILCTTEINRLPATIVSRCFQVKFNKATTSEIVRSLERAIKGEGIKIRPEDVGKIAKNSDGSFRDAVKILEELTQTGKTISSKRVAEVLEKGLAGQDLDDWLVMVYHGEKAKALDWFNKALNEGLDVRQFIVTALDRLREILLRRLGISVEAEEIPAIDDLEKLKKLIVKLLQVGKEMKGAVIESLAIELMIAELEESRSEDRGSTTEKSGQKPLVNKLGKLSLETVLEKWGQVLEAVRPHNHSLEALLKATKPAGFDGKCLNIQVFYKFHKEQLELDRYRQIIEETIAKVLAYPVTVKYYLGERKSRSIVKTESEKIEEIFTKGVN
ncbi:MAG: DNA polymerase III subunit gamma/tau [Candidatus Beckwithbacteria bacterium]|nr:DNA polymerase III subunit gamma/tau [Candidatus Beckwithbacteria bacterium]